jgi:hypothetical protein
MVVLVKVENTFTGTVCKEISVTLTRKQQDKMEYNPQDEQLKREIKSVAEEILLEELYEMYTDVDIHDSVSELMDHENFDFII